MADTILTPVASATPEDILEDASILRLKIAPDSKQPPWYSARQVVERCGRTWDNAENVLHAIPEHHKAQLCHRGLKGTKNVWCLSEIGVHIYFSHVFTSYQLPFSELERVSGVLVRAGQGQEEEIEDQVRGVA